MIQWQSQNGRGGGTHIRQVGDLAPDEHVRRDVVDRSREREGRAVVVARPGESQRDLVQDGARVARRPVPADSTVRQQSATTFSRNGQ